MLQGYHGDTPTQLITISSLEEEPLEIKEIRSTKDDIIAYKLTTVSDGKEFTLEIKTKEGIKENFRGEITLITNSQKKPELKLSVMGMVKREVKVSPPFLHFGIIDTSKEATSPTSLEKTVRITTVSGTALLIEKIEAGTGWVNARAATSEQGPAQTVVISLDKNNLPKGPFKEKVTIHAKHGEKAEAVDVILEGRVL